MSLKCNLTITYQGVSMMGKADCRSLVGFQELLLGAYYYAIEKLNDLGNFNNTQLLTQA